MIKIFTDRILGKKKIKNLNSFLIYEKIFFSFNTNSYF
jgi:hypothetical protein